MANGSVRDFYKGRSIFVTGGTGFMGKVLIEKLLYSVPDIGNIYIIMRPKRGKSINQRMEEICRLKLFERLTLKNPDLLKKIKPLQGDVLFDNLGLSEGDIETLAKEVSVVFHFAATLKLEAPLKDGVVMNTLGTKRTLDIARRLPKLQIFVHLSTAFCYPDYEVLDERVHLPPANPDKVMKLMEWLDDKQLALITPSFLGPQPNSYTYSKRLAEAVVENAYPELPLVIARPSIVCPAVREPVKGWVDNLNGPVGVMLAAGKGVIRTLLCDGSLMANVVPVDIAINGIIAIAMIEGVRKERPDRIPVYNVDNGKNKPTTWGEVLEHGRKIGRQYPLAMPLWYPNGGLTTNVFLHECRRICFHLAPAYLIDFLMFILGQKRFMVRIQERISQGLEVLQFFTTRPWNFSTTNYESIQEILNEEDRETYLTNVERFDTIEYLRNSVEGGRVFCLKENPDKIHLNRIHHNVLYVLDWFVKIMFWLFVLSCLAAWFEPVKSVLSLGEPVVKYMPFLGAAVFNDNAN